MAKLILIITSVLMAVSIVLGFMNRSKFIALRDAKDSTNAEIKVVLGETDDVITKIDDLKKAIASAEDDRDIAREEISSTERKINSINAKIAAADQAIKEKELKIAEIEEALKPFEGVTPETLNEKIEDMETEIASKEDEISTLEKEIEVTQGQVAKNREAVTGYQSQQQRRTQAIARAGSEATVTAVNNDWGFVVVNAGKNRGVEASDVLLVRRGNQQVGRLDIISIQSNSLVANIVGDSLTQGALLPGDRVIFKVSGATAAN